MIEAQTIDRLRFLAAALAFPSTSRLQAVGELARALNLEPTLYEPNQEVLEAQYHRLFSGQRQCSPHETEYGPGRSVRKAVELADIAGFYRAFNLAIDSQDPEMVDHIALEMDFMAHVGFKERYAAVLGWEEKSAICAHAYREFWQDHLAKWVCSFFEAVMKAAPAGSFYETVARLGLSLAESELERLQLQRGDLTPDNRPIEINECLGCAQQPEAGQEYAL